MPHPYAGSMMTVWPTVTIRHRASTSTHWHFAFMLCCHSNETHAPIANPPNSAQLRGTPYHPPSYIRVRAVVWECGEGQRDRHTDTQMRVTNIHFTSDTPHAKWHIYNTLTGLLLECCDTVGLVREEHMDWWNQPNLINTISEEQH